MKCIKNRINCSNKVKIFNKKHLFSKQFNRLQQIHNLFSFI